MDVVAERRYEALRSRLVDLHYYQPLSMESTQLVEKILGDLVKSVESFQTLKQRHMEMTQAEKTTVSDISQQRAELVRVEVENNDLHKRLIDAQEEHEKFIVSTQLEARQLRDQIEDQNVLHAAETQRWRQVMRENEVLKQKVRELVQINKLKNQDAPPPSISGDIMADFERVAQLSKKVDEEQARMVAMSEQLQWAQNQVSTLEQEKVEMERRLANAPRVQHKPIISEADAEERQKILKKNTQLESQVDFLNTQYEGLKQQQSTLQSTFGKRDNEAKVLAAVKRELEEKISSLEEELKRQQRGVLATMSQTQAQNFETVKVQEERKAQITNLLQVKERLEGEIRKYQEEKDMAEFLRRQEIEPLQERLREEIRSKATATAELESKIHGLQIEVERTASSLQTVESRKADLEARLYITESTGQRNAKEAMEQKQEAERAAMSEQFEAKRTAELEARVAFLTESLETLSGDKKALSEFLEEKRLFALSKEKEAQEIALEKNGLSTQIAASEVTRRGLQEDVQQQKMQRMHLERELQFLKETEIPQLRKTSQKLQKELAMAEEVANVVQQQHRELSQDYDKTTNELYKLRVEKQEVEEDRQREQQDTKARTQTLEQRIGEAEKELREAKRLEAEVKRLQEMEADKSVELVKEKESLIAQVRLFEKEMASIHDRVTELSAIKEDLHQECATESSKVQDKENLLATLMAQLNETKATCDTERLQNDELKVKVSRVQELLAQKQREYEHLEELRRAQCISEVNDHELVSELRKKCHEIEAEKSHCVAEVRLHVSQEDQMKQQHQEVLQENQEMGKQIVQLTSLLNALEQTREQLVAQIHETQETVDRERDLRQDVIHAAAQQSGDVTSLQEQLGALEEALTQVDAERDELQNETDRKSEELVRVSEQLLETREALEKIQCAFEDARRSNDVQTKELFTREEALQRLQTQEEFLAQQTTQTRTELERVQRDRQGIEDDLRNMITENQILNEQIQNLRTLTDNMGSKQEEVAAEKERHLAALQAAVMERDDVLQMYRQSVETAQRQQTQIESLLNEKEDLIETIHDAQLQSQDFEKMNETTKNECRVSQLDVLTLQQQTSKLTRQCEERMKESEQYQQGQVRYAQELAAANLARQDLEVRRLELERDFARVRTRLEEEQYKAENAITQKAEAEAYAKEEQKRARRLEELLAQHRTDATGSEPDLQALYRTLEQQYALIAELDQDLRRLREENGALKSKEKTGD
eukprot:GEMP01002560.1.p1 GENE.GEMP01002560.1~~GEMP01002560.1.p1  ORF type:complete len:1236 (+),score=359.15 GEMP01002560.1:154-3861(+)